MKLPRLAIVSALILGASSLGAGQLSAQEDAMAMLNDLAKQSSDPDRVDTILWFPPEYWVKVFEADPSMTENDRADLEQALGPYHLFYVASGRFTSLGATVFDDENEVLQSIWLIDAEGTEYQPLRRSELAPDTQMLLSMMEPMLGAMMGNYGESMFAVAFPTHSSAGERIGALDEPGRITIMLNNQPYTWDLPFCSAVPPKICPVDGEEVCGAWTYCPFHGAELLDSE